MHLVHEGVGVHVKNQVIDFVIPWVDGNDSAWLSEKNKYLQELEKDTYGSFWIDAGDNRYRDWGNLHYWFRAVEKYAPWVNRIHLIVWRDVPDWLQTEHPKLHIVRHADYIPADCLPVFSSHPIELNMHRIPGLAEQFVYFNDDMFLAAPVKPTDFFVDGLPCDSVSERPNFAGGFFQCICLNNIAYINRHFSRMTVRKTHKRKWFTLRCPRDLIKNLMFIWLKRDCFFGFTSHHLPQPFLKSTFEEMWKLEPELLEETSKHRFRNARDVNQYIFRFHQFMTGKFYPYCISVRGRVYGSNDDCAHITKNILKQKYQRICVNDNEQVDFELVKGHLNAAFEKMLPEKCSFEK